jgi:hypothetical protein
MYDQLKSAFSEIVGSIISPILNWILSLSWWARTSFVLMVLLIAGLWNNPAIAYNAAAYVNRAARVVFADSHRIPITHDLNVEIRGIRDRLMQVSLNDTGLIKTDGLTGWSASQTLLSVAARTDRKHDEDQLIAHIRAKRLVPCSCWAELNDESATKAWTFINGWVLTALAARQTPAEASELRFLLEQQNPDGSWPAIPMRNLTDYASVYATAWAVKGLLAQRGAKLITDESVARQTDDAIKRGAGWLLTKRYTKARWKPYPNLVSSSPSGSISGLVMHVLHLSMPEYMDSIDQEWLDNIPASPIPASLGENNYIEIKSGATKQIDHFVQLTMPWMLMATIDSYPQGSWDQKIKALAWIEQTLSHESIRNADAEQGNWWRAELLISLNHLIDNIDYPAIPPPQEKL